MRFVDSNIWLYAAMRTPDLAKREKAIAVLKLPGIVVSTQVVNETCYNLIRKWRFDSLRVSRFIEAIYRRSVVVPVDKTSILKALDLRGRYGFSFWDSQLIACALLGGCSIFESEDMHDGLVVEGALTIHNPLG